MIDEMFLLQLEDSRLQRSSRLKKQRGMRAAHDFDGFECRHCHTFVTSEPLISGVRNRNHCPYCLWSRHMDLWEAGDRLAACRAPMEPVGLTLKLARKKYGSEQGELMIIHRCIDCGKLSLNRIAADDLPDRVWYLYELTCQTGTHWEGNEEIVRLGPQDHDLIHGRLFGWDA